MFARRLDLGLPAALVLALLAVLGVELFLSRPAKLDIVFVLDCGPAMMCDIDAMKANCLEKAEELRSKGLNCRFGVIPFGGDVQGIPTIPMTDDLESIKRRIMEPSTADTQHARSDVEALDQALKLALREDASIFFYMITNTPSQQSDAIAGLASRMNVRGIKAIIQADAAEQDFYAVLYQNGGRFFSMEGEDLTGPSALAGQGTNADSRALSLLAPSPSGLGTIGVNPLYGLRTKRGREKWIGKLGGSEESEQAVKDGLEWLARHQADDGHWSDEKKCDAEKSCSQLVFMENQGAPVAETGLALLAFQANGNYYFNTCAYSQRVKLGLDWLVSQQKEDGRLFGALGYRHHSMYEHGIATFALAEACATAVAEKRVPNERYLNATQRAVEFIERHQYPDGGWRYSLTASSGDTSVSGWQVLALKSALEAKIEVAPETIERTLRFFESCVDPSTGRTVYAAGEGPRPLTTAIGLIVQQFMVDEPDSPLERNAKEYLASLADTGVGDSGDFYFLYNATLAMFLVGGEPWQRWNSKVRDAVLKRQEKSGCARGSWRRTNENDGNSRTLATAWAVLILEVYYRYATEQETHSKEKK